MCVQTSVLCTLLPEQLIEGLSRRVFVLHACICESMYVCACVLVFVYIVALLSMVA